MSQAQGIEQKIDEERFICIRSQKITSKITGSQKIEIPPGAEYVRGKKGKINFYTGKKPEPNGYTQIPEGTIYAWLPDYKDRGLHKIYGEFKFN